MSDFLCVQRKGTLFYRWLFIVTISLFPIVAFISKRANDASFYLFLFLCLYAIFRYRNSQGIRFRSFLSEYWPLSLTMAFPFFAEILNQLFISGFRMSLFDFPFRFILLPVLTYGLLNVPYGDLRQVRWGFTIGALACSFLFFYMVCVEGNVRPLTQNFIELRLINYVNMTLLLGFLTFLSIGWEKTDSKIFFLLKAFIFSLAFLASLISMTRGGWLALPFFVWVGARFLKAKRKNLLIFCSIIALFFFSLFFFNSNIQSRLISVKEDIGQYMKEKKDTSIGIRFQHYQAGVAFFKKSPLFGVGRSGFQEKMRDLASENIISQDAAKVGGWHLHNEFMFQLATGGIFAALSVILFFLVPFCYFYKATRSEDIELRTIACMGVAVSMAFFVFGLTEGVFSPKQTVNFYIFIISVLMALFIQRKEHVAMRIFKA